MPLSTITQLQPFNINTSATFSFANVSTTANIVAGNIKTDNLLYANGSAWSFGGTPGGSNTFVQFNDSSSFGGNSQFTYNKVTNLLTVGNIAGTITTASQPNITSVGTLTSVTITGNVTSGNATLGNLVTANFFSGSGNLLSNVQAANITGTVSNATTAGTVIANAQPNITSVGTLTSVTITGNVSAGNANLGNLVTANFFSGSGNLLSNIQAGNITGTVSNATTAGTVIANAQPNITSVGTLSSVTVTGNVSAGNANLGNLVTANYFTGTLTTATQPNITSIGTLTNLSVTGNLTTGNLITGGSAGNISGANYISANYFTGTLTTAAQPNITSVGTLSSLSITGNVTSGNATLGNLATANFFTGTLTTAAQPNITSVGTLNALAVTANANVGNINATNAVLSGNATITGNLTVSGNTNYVNVDSLVIEDPIIEMGGGVNGAPLTTNDGKDRGSLLHYYTTTTVDAFMGWDNSNAEFGFGSNVSVSGEVVTFNTFGNIRAGFFLGNGSQLTGTIANSNYAAYAGNVINAAQSNITSLGTLTSLTITGNLTSGNATLGNLVTANFFTGTLTTAAQPNITSVGTLSSVSVTGNVSSGNANLGNLVTANFFTGTLTTAAQPNITSVGTLSTLTVTGNVTSGNANLGNLVTANFYDGTLITAAQPNITSTGTLSSLSITGNVTSGNANLGNAVTANYFIGNGSLLTGLPASYSNAEVANYLPTYTGNLSPSNLTVSTSANLGAVGNIIITGGSNGYVLQTDGSGTLSWVVQSGGGGTPGGSNTYVQFNDGSTFGGNAGLVFDKTSNTLTAVNLTVSNESNLGSVSNIIITGGNVGEYLSTDGSGNLSWLTASGSFATVTVDNFTGDGSNVNFTLSVTPPNENYTTVSYNGAIQLRSSYSLSGNVLTLSEAPVNGSSIEVTSLSGLSAFNNADFVVRNYTGDGSDTTFTVTNGCTVTSVLVTENGVLQVPTTDYTISGTTLTFTTAPANGVNIQIRELQVASASNVSTAVTVTANSQPNITSVGTLNSVTATGTVNLTGASNVSLGPIGNIHVSGGNSGEALITDGSGNLSFGTAGVPLGKTVALNMFLGF